MDEIWRHDGAGGWVAAPGASVPAPDKSAVVPTGRTAAPDNKSAADAASARAQSRDSLFMQASIRPLGQGDQCEPTVVRVRNLSAGGLMAEGAMVVTTGMDVSVELANMGEVEGRVAWVGGHRFGVAFTAPVEPHAVRRKVAPVRSRAGDPLIEGSHTRRPALRPR